LNPPICNQNHSVWASERKADIKHHRLLVKRKTFLIAPRVVVSAGVCVGGKGRLHLKNCWWKIVSSCYRMVSFSSKTALRLTRHASHSHRTGCSQTAVTSSTRMSAPPPSLPGLNTLDYHVWGQCWSLIISCGQSQKSNFELKEFVNFVMN